jgi:sporulation protein YlmC with PRC-barrel domain
MVKHAGLKLGSCTPLLFAAALALSACSQQGPDFLSSPSPPAAPSAPSAPAPEGPRAALRASTLISMPVESRSGQVLGRIRDILFNPDGNGHATHVIIAYGKGGAGERLVAIPWWTAVSDIHHDALVVKAARLEGAPSFAPGNWPELTDPSWSDSADDYWTVPIDSTSRSRARPPL